MKHPRMAVSQVLDRRRQKEEARQKKFDGRRVLGEGALQNEYVLVASDKLNPDNVYAWGTPDFVTRGYYVARPFTCQSCGVAQVWTETQQKWWYEVVKGNVWSQASLCRPCRRRERDRRAAAREAELAGRAAKRPRKG